VTLIIDEISMIDAGVLNYVSAAAQQAKSTVGAPFGGIRVIACGDFLQLPPASNGKSYCFNAAAWTEGAFQAVVLTEPHRQCDPAFVKFLHGLRVGATDMAYLTQLVLGGRERAAAVLGDPGAVRLRCTNAEVDAINAEELAKLPARARTHTFAAFGHLGAAREYGIPLTVSLTVGCRVMLRKNLSLGAKLVNGSIGTVVGFVDAADVSSKRVMPDQSRFRRRDGNGRPTGVFPVVDFGREKGGRQAIGFAEWSTPMHADDEATIVQVPLRLAWAITVHKSQGTSLDAVEVDLKLCFSPGQAYVALSRARSAERLVVKTVNPARLRPFGSALTYHRSVEGGAAAGAAPL
jgi:ATP-dependent DNA helicase PIF1